MNPQLERLRPYPFERLNALKAGARPPSGLAHIALQIGEPKHAPPAFVVEALREVGALEAGLRAYPPTRGGGALREAISGWLQRRFGATVNPETEVLPVNGTREALFSFGQAVLSGAAGSRVMLPNPFYQIYEGAALLRGATPLYLPCSPQHGHLPDFHCIDAATWRATELVYLCSPANPTGAVLPLEELQRLIELAQRFNFVVAADECYCAIYRDENAPPPGLLQAAAAMGETAFRRCVVFHSLSKRSNLPGLRSGFVAGDAALIERYFLYRTYHGCAMPAHVQAASALAWADEAHVVENRERYRRKFDAVLPILSGALDVRMPEGAFYLWPSVPGDDAAFARALHRRQNVTVMPGSFLGRERNGENPGAGRVRIALVGEKRECVTAAHRIKAFLEGEWPVRNGVA